MGKTVVKQIILLTICYNVSSVIGAEGQILGRLSGPNDNESNELNMMIERTESLVGKQRDEINRIKELHAQIMTASSDEKYDQQYQTWMKQAKDLTQIAETMGQQFKKRAPPINHEIDAQQDANNNRLSALN